MQDTAYPDWSPDGKTIAFQSYKSGTFHIWAMNPDGSNVRELTVRLLRRPRAAVLPRRDEDRVLLRPAAGRLARGHRDRVLQHLDADPGHRAADRDHPPVGRDQRLLPDLDSGRQADHLRRHEPRDREHRRRRDGHGDDAVLRPRQHLLLADLVARRQEPRLHRARQPGHAHPAVRQRQRGLRQRGRVRLPGSLGVQRQPDLRGRRQDPAAQPVHRRRADDPVLGQGVVQPRLLSDEGARLRLDGQAAGHRHPQPRALARRAPCGVRGAQPAVGDEDRAHARWR